MGLYARWEHPVPRKCSRRGRAVFSFRTGDLSRLLRRFVYTSSVYRVKIRRGLQRVLSIVRRNLKAFPIQIILLGLLGGFEQKRPNLRYVRDCESQEKNIPLPEENQEEFALPATGRQYVGDQNRYKQHASHASVIYPDADTTFSGKQQPLLQRFIDGFANYPTVYSGGAADTATRFGCILGAVCGVMADEGENTLHQWPDRSVRATQRVQPTTAGRSARRRANFSRNRVKESKNVVVDVAATYTR